MTQQDKVRPTAAAAEILKELAKNLVSLSEIILNSPLTAAENLEESSAANGKAIKGSSKKVKAEKDPNAPKRNLSSYMLYSQAVRQEVVNKNPELKAVEIAKLIGEKWNALSDKEKQPYVKQAEKEKQRFDKETASYKSKLGEEHDDTPTKRKASIVEEPSSSKKKSKKAAAAAEPSTEQKKKNAVTKKKN